MKLINIESKLNDFENAISSLPRKHVGLTMIPGVLILPGALKVLLGVVQTVTAATALVFSPLTWCCTKGISKHSFKHIMHGMGNIVAGILESIPLVAHALGFVRKDNKQSVYQAVSFSDPSFKLVTNHENKYFPYETLAVRDIHVLVKSSMGRIANMNYQALTADAYTLSGAQHKALEVHEKFTKITTENPDVSLDEMRTLFHQEINRNYGIDPQNLNADTDKITDVWMRWDSLLFYDAEHFSSFLDYNTRQDRDLHQNGLN